jgi:hypothetical protein
MKVLVLNVQHARGVSGKTGNQYDICTLSYGVPHQNVNKEGRQVTGFGYMVSEVGMNAAALPQFADVKFPAMLELDVSPDPTNLRRNICNGIR